MTRTIERAMLGAVFFLVIFGGIIFLGSAIRGTRPYCDVLWSKRKSGDPLPTRTRIGWGALGVIMIFLGVIYLFSIL